MNNIPHFKQPANRYGSWDCLPEFDNREELAEITAKVAHGVISPEQGVCAFSPLKTVDSVELEKKRRDRDSQPVKGTEVKEDDFFVGEDLLVESENRESCIEFVEQSIEDYSELGSVSDESFQKFLTDGQYDKALLSIGDCKNRAVRDFRKESFFNAVLGITSEIERDLFLKKMIASLLASDDLKNEKVHLMGRACFTSRSQSVFVAADEYTRLKREYFSFFFRAADSISDEHINKQMKELINEKVRSMN